ncbi:MAG: DUF721 domain-containing protein [Armatimonadetes bacterium]|nr:DUF721 domain-containing protein [Armatimonadota bacterium]
MRRMKPLGEALPEALDALGLAATARAAMAVTLWPDVAGPHTAAHSCAVAFQEGVLVIVTDHSVWEQELSLLKPGLLAEYRRRLGKGVVRDLRFRVNAQQVRARVGQRQGETSAQTPPDPPAASRAAEPAVPRRQAEHPDPEIARLLEQVYAEEARQRQTRREGAPVCGRCGAPNPRRGSLCPACRVEQQTG